MYAEFQDEEAKRPCAICYLDIANENQFNLHQCESLICKNCFIKYLTSLVDSASVIEIGCPLCGQVFSTDFIKECLPEGYKEKYQKFYDREILNNNPYVRFCPQPDCEGYSLGSIKKAHLVCSACKFEYCFLCGMKWHREKCEKKNDFEFEKWVNENGVKFCPKCKRRVEKSGGCPNMKCVCNYSWCWKCGKKPSDRYHIFTCYIGNDIWNIKKTVLFLMIIAPIALYFIPFVFLMLFFIEEPDAFLRFHKYRYWVFLAVFLLSPVIEGFFLVGYCFYIGCYLVKMYQKQNVFVAFLLFFSGSLASIVGMVVGTVLVVIGSFVVSLGGVVLAVMRVCGEFIGKKDYSEQFYPQSIV